MRWVSLAIAALKVLASLVKFLSDRKMIRAGEDRIIAKQAITILESTQQGKRLREKVKALDDEDADQLWDDLIT